MVHTINLDGNLILWKKHPKYEKYEANNLGHVRMIGGKLRKMREDKDGYLRFNILFERKHKTIKAHSFVWECFYGLIKSGMTINHMNLVKDDNRIFNLELLSSGDNLRHCLKNFASRSCVPVKIDGVLYYSKREAERVTGIYRRHMKKHEFATNPSSDALALTVSKDGPHFQLPWKEYP